MSAFLYRQVVFQAVIVVEVVLGFCSGALVCLTCFGFDDLLRQRGVQSRWRRVIVRPRHLTSLYVELPTRATTQAGAVCFVIKGERTVHLRMPASEDALEPPERY